MCSKELDRSIQLLGLLQAGLIDLQADDKIMYVLSVLFVCSRTDSTTNIVALTKQSDILITLLIYPYRLWSVLLPIQQLQTTSCYTPYKTYSTQEEVQEIIFVTISFTLTVPSLYVKLVLYISDMQI